MMIAMSEQGEMMDVVIADLAARVYVNGSPFQFRLSFLTRFCRGDTVNVNATVIHTGDVTAL